MGKKYVAEVVGCRTNQYELQAMKELLEARGYEAAYDDEEADICLVNTCAVTDNAESSSRHAIRGFLQRHPRAKIIATGCLAQKDPHTLSSLSSAVEVVPLSEKERFFEKEFPEIAPTSFRGITTFDGHTRAFVKIQDGCSCFCSYCIVPYLRGTSRSREKEEIYQEIEGLIASSYKEIVLTGVNVGDFSNQKCSLTDLLVGINSLPGLKRLRLSSINPNDIDEDFIEVVSSLSHFCPSLHLVLQSGSNAVLKRMRRKYVRETYLDRVARLREKNPLFSFSTDIIVGFPGETEEDFAETVEVVRSVKFSKVHVFPYSPREGTYAARLPDHVPVEIVKRRKSALAKLSDECAHSFRERFVGTTLSMLTEKAEDAVWMSGLTPHGIVVRIPKGTHSDNEELQVYARANGIDGLEGECV